MDKRNFNYPKWVINLTSRLFARQLRQAFQFVYKGSIIYNTRYQDSCGSSSNLSTGSGHTPGSGGLVGGSGASGGVAGNGSNGASAIAAAGGCYFSLRPQHKIILVRSWYFTPQ